MFDWKSFLRQKNALVILLYINVGVFLFTKFLMVIMTLFKLPTNIVTEYLMLPASMTLLPYRPWTLITYMFLHVDFSHLFFNALCLIWFGRLFLNYYTQRQLTGLYLLGGAGSGLCYILAYNVFPYFSDQIVLSRLIGASGSIMAIILAITMLVPNYEFHLFLLGRIKLKWIAATMVLLSAFGITSNNAGGEFAHIGGAIIGVIYAWLLQKNYDLTVPFNRTIDTFVNLFKFRPRIKTNKNQTKKNSQQPQNNPNITAILRKIKAYGYTSLSEEEKRQLFNHNLDS